MKLFLLLVILYFIGGIVFLITERIKAARKIKRTEKEIEHTKEPLLRGIKKLSIRKQRNLLEATWKDNLTIITIWIIIKRMKGA